MLPVMICLLIFHFFLLSYTGAFPVGTYVSTCFSAPEHSTVYISCIAGYTISQIIFISFGAGMNGCQTVGYCHAATSYNVGNTYCLNRNACQITAGNNAFGDPWYSKFNIYICVSY